MRNYNMDFIRGIAVLCLVYMNGYAFGLMDYSYIPLSTPPFSDTLIHAVSTFFVDGRFRTLFSLLFGAGLYIQWQKVKSTAPLKARLHWLIIFGLVHGFLLWAGDILFLYGVSAWFALKYLQSNNQLLVKRAGEFLLIGCVATGLVLFSAPDEVVYRDSAQYIDLYSPHYSDYFLSNLGMNILMLVAVPIMIMWLCVGLMLIGIYLYKNEVFSKGLTKPNLIVCIAGAFIFSGMRLYTSKFTGGAGLAIQEFINTFAALFMAVFYIHLIVKFCNNRAHVGQLIQQAGRLAFTLYICQTLMQLLLYKVLYPQWVLSFNRIDYWIVATGLVSGQLLFTALYCRYYEQGPLEYVWRRLTQAKIAKINA